MSPSPAATLEVLVVEHRDMGKPCAEGCGTDWLVEDNQRLAQQVVERAFGPRVKLRFVNLADPAAQESSRELMEQVRSQGLTLPALIINGEVKIAGYFDLRMLNDMIDAAMELA